eukprot:TRINITY_DN4497_c1_g1_i1.p1 TRINITY_DN4497_c1_g1~~TRINITY_DN4497_c1_g1_i1.p1  ORF type:complete len:727 (+),score=131.29 TRINITY_DN4497_c1_g1_i1:79-2181(+)
MGLTDEQQDLMEESWKMVNSAGLDQLGFRHYKILVQMGGDEIRTMFMYTHLDRQQKMLISTMKWMMFNVNNSEGLRRLALYHAHLKVTERLFGLFGKAFIEAMKETVGPQFDLKYQTAWATAYQLIADSFVKFLKVYGEQVTRAAKEEEEVAKRNTYNELRNYFRDERAENFLALSDKEGSVYVSQYEREQLPTSVEQHDRTMFRKRWLVLRGRYLYIQKKENQPPQNILDLGYCSLEDTSTPGGRLPSPSPFSFALTDDTGMVTYFLLSGDDEKEVWGQILLQVLSRFYYLREAVPRSTGVLSITVLGEELIPKEFCEDDFEMLVLIGKGTFGKVYKVKEVATGKIYAVKVLKKSALKRESQITDLRNEKGILLNISHPFIVKLHATFQSKDRLFLLFTFLSGGELFFHIQQSESYFSEAKSRFYIAETALAVSYLHENNIVHRDLKAENLVLSAEGHVCLTDFGFAKTIEKDAVPNQTCGTLAYMAPEIFSKSAMGYGQEVDWWSLGVLLFNMLTLCYPFLRATTIETVTAITSEPLKFPEQPILSEDAVDLLIRLLTKRPKDRLTDMNDMKNHPWFRGFDWEACLRKELAPPFVPISTGRNTKYFRPCEKGTSLASIAQIEEQMELSSFFDVHQTYFTQHVVAAEKGTRDALNSKMDIQGLMTRGEELKRRQESGEAEGTETIDKTTGDKVTDKEKE